MSFTSLVTAAAGAHSEPAVNPWLVGVVTLALLVALLVGLFSFGKGREHS